MVLGGDLSSEGRRFGPKHRIMGGHFHINLLLTFIFLKKWANPILFLFIFVLFSLQFQ